MDALRCATVHGAAYLGMENDLGTIEEGKLADMIIFQPGKNPTIEIRDSEYIEYVVANGRLYEATSMTELGNHPGKRQPFYWESNPLGARVMMSDPARCAGCRQ